MGQSKNYLQASFSVKLIPSKLRNADIRPREYLPEKEVHLLMKVAAKTGRHGHRDAALILITCRHGLRVSDVIAVEWDLVDLGQGRLHVNRLEKGIPSVHPLRGVRDSSIAAAATGVS